MEGSSGDVETCSGESSGDIGSGSGKYSKTKTIVPIGEMVRNREIPKNIYQLMIEKPISLFIVGLGFLGLDNFRLISLIKSGF